MRSNNRQKFLQHIALEANTKYGFELLPFFCDVFTLLACILNAMYMRVMYVVFAYYVPLQMALARRLLWLVERRRIRLVHVLLFKYIFLVFSFYFTWRQWYRHFFKCLTQIIIAIIRILVFIEISYTFSIFLLKKNDRSWSW